MTDWEVQLPFRHDVAHPVRSIRTLYDIQRNEHHYCIRWWDNLAVWGLGEGYRYMYEDTAFDLQSILDDVWGRCIDCVGWSDWRWVDV